MFDKFIKSFEYIQKELLFLLIPVCIISGSIFFIQEKTLPLYRKLDLSKRNALSQDKHLKQKEQLLLQIDALLSDSLNIVSEVSKDSIPQLSKNEAMALLFSLAKESSIIINRSTPSTIEKQYSINLDFRCSFKEILTFLQKLSSKKELLTVHAISLHSDRGVLRCSMSIRFLCCGE